MIARGSIVGELQGVERVEEAGDAVSSSDDNRISAELIEDGDGVCGGPAEGNDVARTVGGA